MSLETRLAALISAIGADIKDLWASIDALPPEFNPIDRLRTEYSIYDDFSGEVQGVYVAAQSGTGASTGLANIPDAGSAGVISATTGSTATGRTALRSTSATLNLGQGPCQLAARVRVPILSTATERFAFRVGFGDVDTGDMVDGLYFEYDESVSANWRCKSANNSARTTVDSGVAVAINTWYVLEVFLSAGGTTATYYINNSLVATITTNIPTASGRDTGVGFWLIKSAGTTARTILLDYLGARQKYNTAR